MKDSKKMEALVSLAKRRGFVFPSSEIYGGIANTWDFGPLGVLMKKHIKDHWWNSFIASRFDMVGQDGSIIMNPKVWVASGHVAGFNDALVDCTGECKSRYRADHLIEEMLDINAEGLGVEDMTKLIHENGIMCPKCGGEFTAVRWFNTMFQTNLGPVESTESKVYLRPETCQAIYVDFKNVQQASRKKIPFGIGQIGKAFRNEITPGNFIFRVLEFEQMEIEYFVKPGDDEKAFNMWLDLVYQWYITMGVTKEHLRLYEHSEKERSFYSKRTVDIQYEFPFGWKELHGIANRTDYDLTKHTEFSGIDLSYFDEETKEHYLPYIIEPSVSVERIFLMLLADAYAEEEVKPGDCRVVLHLDPRIAPYTAAILPLMKRDGLDEKAKDIAKGLMANYSINYDETGSIGKRYRRQDEIGTPYAITIDYQTLEDDTVTIRDRDSMLQERIAIDTIAQKLSTLVTK